MKPKLYERLPGRGRRSGLFALSAPRTSLWLGADHLLSLDSTATAETCRRFYYRDIEALIIRQTNGRRNWNLFWLILGLLCAAPWLLTKLISIGSEIGTFISIFAGAICLVFILINSLLGSTCKASIRTAVQIEELPTLGRTRRALKVFDRLRPRIFEAQGSVDFEQIARADWSASPAQTGGRLPEPVSNSGPQGEVRPEPGTLHMALFTLLLGEAALGFWCAWQAPEWVDSLKAAMMLGGIFLLILALRRQSHSDLPAGVRRLAWAVAVYYGTGMITGGIWGALYAAQHAGQSAPMQPSALRGSYGWNEVTLGSACAALLIGLAGLGLLLLRKKQAATLPPPMPAES